MTRRAEDAAVLSVQEAATGYLRAGWQPLALRPRTKMPRAGGWQNRVLSAGDIAAEFQAGDNIGLRCGAPSGGLIDIDIDDARARPLAHRWLPPTAMRHGRPGNPDSHRWYAVDDKEYRTEQFKDPVGNAMLIELRGDGGQTMVPPSVHPSGERLAWSESEHRGKFR